jgi:gamma-glutamyltranspeptidase / glutathione hydrolase
MQKNRGAIAAGHHKTAEAGQAMLALGGNAFDAAIAAVLTSFVVEPTLSSAAGGGFLLAHTQDKQNILFDFFCQTPRRKKPVKKLDFYPVKIDFGDAVQTFHIGLGSIATPGNLAGVWRVHKRLGKLPFEVVAGSAIDCAAKGFALGNFIGSTFKILEPILTQMPESRRIFAPDGDLLQVGQICSMPEFAETLKQLSQQGIEAFYQGELARQLVSDLDRGGYLTLEDLSNYRVIERKPLQINYRGYELITNPPPSSGGILIAFALKLLEKFDLSRVEFGSDRHLEILARVMSLTNAARKDRYDNGIYHADIDRHFLDEYYLANYHSQLSGIANKWGSTTHISTIDSEGNAASVTVSNGEGSGYVIPKTGIMLNNMLGEADLNPLGFHEWQCDRRLSSMMSPTIVLKAGEPELVLGSGGSNRIRTAILQVISNYLDFNLSLETAIANSRVHWENGIFNIEPIAELDLQRLQLPEASETVLWTEKNLFFGGVHAVRKTAQGNWEGVGDPRREGVAIAT